MRRRSRLSRGSSIGSRRSRTSTSNAGYLGPGTIASMGRSLESALRRVARDSIARSAVIDRRYRKRCWRAVVAVAMLARRLHGQVRRCAAVVVSRSNECQRNSARLQKLNVLGRVLYIAAHPDDENTNLMAFWSNGSLYDAAYLSVTRGDGGQNMTGPGTGRAARRHSNGGIARCATHRPRQAILHASTRFRVFEDG